MAILKLLAPKPLSQSEQKMSRVQSQQRDGGGNTQGLSISNSYNLLFLPSSTDPGMPKEFF